MGLKQSPSERLREARKDAHLTQVQLGKAAGYTSQFISDLERGKKLTFEAAHNLAKVLHVSAEWLKGEDDCKTIDDYIKKQDYYHEMCYGVHAVDLMADEQFGITYDEGEKKFIIECTHWGELIPENDNNTIASFNKNKVVICTAEEMNTYAVYYDSVIAAMTKTFIESCTPATEEELKKYDRYIAYNKIDKIKELVKAAYIRDSE